MQKRVLFFALDRFKWPILKEGTESLHVMEASGIISFEEGNEGYVPSCAVMCGFGCNHG